MQLSIRQATDKDTATVQQFAVMTYMKAFGYTLTEEDVKLRIDKILSVEKVREYIIDDMVLIAEQQGELVGYIHISDVKLEVITPTQTSKQLQRLYVHPDYQGQMIGSRLIDTALSTDLFKNADYIYLDVWEKNTGAIKLYQKHGFSKVAEIQFIHETGEKGDFDWIMCREQSAK